MVFGRFSQWVYAAYLHSESNDISRRKSFVNYERCMQYASYNLHVNFTKTSTHDCEMCMCRCAVCVLINRISCWIDVMGPVIRDVTTTKTTTTTTTDNTIIYARLIHYYHAHTCLWMNSSSQRISMSIFPFSSSSFIVCICAHKME